MLGDGLLLGHVDDWHKGREAWLFRALDALELALGVRGDFERSTHRRMGSTSIRAVGDIAGSYSVIATSRVLPFCLVYLTHLLTWRMVRLKTVNVSMLSTTHTK